MVDDSALREKISLSTKGLWGTMFQYPTSLFNVFGRTKAPAIGATNYYNVEAFIANAVVSVGDEYVYKYAQGKNELKARMFQRFASGVKLTEEMYELDSDSLKGIVEAQIKKVEAVVETELSRQAIGYRSLVELMGCMNLQGTANSSIIDPADCNDTPGTEVNLAAVKWSGPAKTEDAINATVGYGQRAIAAKALDATTGESICRNDGTDTWDLWVHPIAAKILETNCQLLDTGLLDTMTYAQRLKADWKTTVRPTMQIENMTVAAAEHPASVLTCNTKENYFIVDVEKPTWKPWKDIDDGEKIAYVKRYRAGLGAVARPFVTPAGQAYKAQFSFGSIFYATA